jgi:catechol 2,3-dioxygenase-like lactoylglutathione lyase family enzyme
MKFMPEHLGLPAPDPAALKDWYLKYLDARLVFTTPDAPPAYFVELPGRLMLEIYQSDSALAQTSHNGLAGWRHLALQVDSIEQAKLALEQKGLQFTDPIKPAGGGGRVLFFRDTAQNLLHLVERPVDSNFRL